MNKSFLLGMGAGFVAGAGIATITVLQIAKKITQEAIEIEAEAIRLDYARHYAGAVMKPSLTDMLGGDADFDGGVVVTPERTGKTEAAERVVKQARAASEEIIHEMGYDTPATNENAPPWNVFNESVVTTPEADRSAEHPYVIAMEEFQEDKPDYGKITLTYFAEDDVLIEEKGETPVSIEDLVGVENLKSFGYDKRDKDILFIRNERFESDYEITRDERSYTEVVFGYPDAKPVPRKRKKTVTPEADE